MIVIRLLLRIILVPLGAALALWVATLVVLVAQWGRLMAVASSAQSGNESFLVMLVILGPIYLLVWLLLAFYSSLPAIVGVLIAEAFAVRHWIFHVFNGALSVWIGSTLVGESQKGSEYLEMPVAIVAAGIAAGFAYWAVAGWNAGFWKPVFAPPAAPQQPRSKPDVLPRPPAAQA